MAKRLSLPDSPETTLYRAIVKVLQNDPALQRIGVKWGIWNDTEEDMREISPAICPYIELSPAPGDTGWREENQHATDFNIDIFVTVEGSCADDLLNLWGAIRSALFPPDGSAQRDAVDAYLGPKTINGSFTRQPFQIVPLPGSPRMLQGEGSLKLRMNVNT